MTMKPGKEHMPALVFLLLCLIWGSTWMAIKLGLEDSPPFFSAGVRFAIAAVVLAFLVKVRHLSLSYGSRVWRLMGLTGVIIGFGYGAIYWGEQYISSGLSAVLFATLTLFVGLFSHFTIADERLGWLKTAGIVTGFIGVVLIFADRLGLDSTSWWGCISLLFSSALMAAGSVLIKKALTQVNPIVLTAVQMTLAAVILLSFGVALERVDDFLITSNSIGAVLYLSFIGTVFAFVIYYWLMQRVQVTRVSLIVLVTPLVAVFLGWLLMGEIVNVRMVVGSALVLGGVGIALR
jgi:drug/metabolite transporter (DMT)-like permease